MKKAFTYLGLSITFFTVNSFLGCGGDDNAFGGSTSNNGTLQYVSCVNDQSIHTSSGKTASNNTITMGTCTGCESEVTVNFTDCGCIEVNSCKDISNVVLGLANGQEYKYDNLSGHQGTFCTPNEYSIFNVWVKSGCYLSGDGPGYGYAFQSPLGCGVLPVTLEDFYGYWPASSRQVNLNWTVSQEVNLEGYMVRMLMPCEDFEANNFITLNHGMTFQYNSTGAKVYDMEVPVNEGGKYYFQLFELDLDGNETLLETIYVNVGE